MSSQSSASLREEWELTEKSLSDLIAVGGQQQSRVALTALEAQLHRFQLWARFIGLPDDGVDNYLNLPKMESILYDCRRHIADAMQPGKLILGAGSDLSQGLRSVQNHSIFRFHPIS